ncbi:MULTISPECIES: MlaD family protein [Mycobacteroides]|jgi:phospholipid/cholesterol/gamma-HCH transport system substrate-binding protein|uniref:MCE family protein n=1 Tax=Mycobacteroides chelonae TaxID=1774 RepID=A0AB73U785_MYCCH|nr:MULTISPECIES: MlaD family protein [Mycobacteroides]KRQ21978.1 mammalian cell entry protein [Mycobacteroides sp. H072]KRQ30896.1 mammalian cell entry protein [Mycobacteroides sp. H002]KRQ51594.1 mammalian cell entry protein [Mycobacteroides sp. H054]KRQ69734.1 mammalian cell entry protein [Mycobacteroides sp. H001]MBF9318843.1 MCE family protein [Mycobacteroides chelonae]
MRLNVLLTLAVLSIISLVGAVYMAFGVLDIASTNKTNHMTLMLESSGGLMSTSQVTLRGIKVGRVTNIQATPSGLAISMALDSGYPIPVDSKVSVQNLSAAGEQYVEFKPARIEPPYYSDGAVIPASKAAPVYTVSDLLQKGNALMQAMNADDLEITLNNVAAGFVDNTKTIDQLATTARLFAQMVKDDKHYLAEVIGNTSTLTNGLGEIRAGDILKQSAKTIPGSLDGLASLVKVIEKLEPLVEAGLGDGKPLTDLVEKLFDYINALSEPMSEFATVLEPIVAPLRDVKLDAGHWLDFWDSTFNNQGGLRIHLGVPEWPQPDTPQPGSAQPSRPAATPPAPKPTSAPQTATAGRPGS